MSHEVFLQHGGVGFGRDVDTVVDAVFVVHVTVRAAERAVEIDVFRSVLTGQILDSLGPLSVVDGEIRDVLCTRV